MVLQVNGCKKRKLYQPQQHDVAGHLDDTEEDEENEEGGPAVIKEDPEEEIGEEREHLRSQLREVQAQLAAMQQRYAEQGPNMVPPPSAYQDYHHRATLPSNPVHHLASTSDHELLFETLKQELSSSVTKTIEAVMSQYISRHRRSSSVVSEDLLSQMLDRSKSPKSKVIDRGNGANVKMNGHYHHYNSRVSPSFSVDSLTAKTPPSSYYYHPSMKSVFCSPPTYLHTQPEPEQTEAMSLVVAPKKKRHKVTDTRVVASGAIRRYDDGGGYPVLPPPPLVPASLPTSVAIPNPSLHVTDMYHHHEETPVEYPPSRSPEPYHYSSSPYGTPRPPVSSQTPLENGDGGSDTGDSPALTDSGIPMVCSLTAVVHTSTLTPMHLRKAKLMFFYVRYPSSAILKMYFPDIKFNKNNTAQLVKWFSNFREFFYIQMEKYARQAHSEGLKCAEDIKVMQDSELLRCLNLHYNRNNHIEAPDNFRYVVEQTLREFFRAIVAGKDQEPSWKKAIYKLIARLDDNVPEYFKTPNFLEQLE